MRERVLNVLMKQENSQLDFKAGQSIIQLSAIVITDLSYLSES